jgi:hypothetical protein
MEENANLQTVDIDIDDFSTGIGGQNILTPTFKGFSRDNVDTQALNNFSLGIDEPTEQSVTTNLETPTTPEEPKFQVPDNFNEQVNNPEISETEEKDKVERAKLDKSSLVEYLKDKIESKEFTIYDDYDEKTPVEDYLSKLSKKDLHSLIDENLKVKEDQYKQEVPKQFFESLPYELQVAADYWVNKGGRDLKGLFNALGKVEEIRDLDPDKDTDQEQIVQEYLRAANTDWSSEEVREQLDEYKDLGQLEKRAKQFKPKLDRMKEQMVQYQLEQQEIAAQQMRQRAQAYQKSVYDALSPGEINGLKLDTKTQNALYNGLIRADYQSVSGGNTNKLGYLLEKYQYSEPNYGLISEVLWHLEDPEGFRNALIQKGKNTQAENDVKKLKTQQGDRSSSTAFEDQGNASRIRNTISKPEKNIFKR